MSTGFWDYLQRLVNSSRIVIDRPRGSTHPRYPEQPYPVEYGYLEGTTAIDSGGVDIWVGSLNEKRVVGALCTVDLLKRDTELKIVYDCTEDEIQAILSFVSSEQMQAKFIYREA